MPNEVDGEMVTNSQTQQSDSQTSQQTTQQAQKIVNVAGVDMPEEVAKYVSPLVEAFSQQLNYLQGQLEQTQQTKTTTTQTKDGYDYAVKLFTDPEEALAKLREEIKAEIKAEQSQTTQQQDLANQFWNEFYSDNKDLKEHDFVVRAVMNRDYNKMQNWTNDRVFKHVAAETKKILMVKDQQETKDEEGVVLEGSGRSVTRGGHEFDQSAPANPTSISEVLNKRRAARLKQANGG